MRFLENSCITIITSILHPTRSTMDIMKCYILYSRFSSKAISVRSYWYLCNEYKLQSLDSKGYHVSDIYRRLGTNQNLCLSVFSIILGCLRNLVNTPTPTQLEFDLQLLLKVVIAHDQQTQWFRCPWPAVSNKRCWSKYDSNDWVSGWGATVCRAIQMKLFGSWYLFFSN